MIRNLSALIATFAVTTALWADNWPGWRGPTGQGQCSETKLPLKWSDKDNVRWKVALPDAGNSTPIVWGDRVFITQASEKKDWPPVPGAGGLASAYKRSLMCFQRGDGKLLWEQTVLYKEKESTHPTNPFCSSSPVTDGERVIAWHGSAGLFCYDLDGKELWKKDLGKFEHIWGNASSPVIYQDLCLLWAGPGERQFLLALDKKTGKDVWKHDEPGGNYGKAGGSSWIGSWSTPIIVKVGGQDQIILSVPRKCKGFDPKTGKELWVCEGLTNLVYTSPLSDGNIVVAMSGFHGSALAFKLGGSGDITKDRLWHHAKQNPQRIGSGVIVGKHVYMIEAEGAPHCYELETGKEVWDAQVEKRPGGGTWSSIVHADGKLYLVTRTGETFIFAASPKYQLLAQNRIGPEHTDASIAVSSGDLFIRTHRSLWCISEKK